MPHVRGDVPGRDPLKRRARLCADWLHSIRGALVVVSRVEIA
ncbi:Hypothetical protein A7982_07250 [Minicystis rosea]|nr:Hypothetical protein A7982_07250 [Minicystis rosea]